jgi:hypothetical protein
MNRRAPCALAALLLTGAAAPTVAPSAQPSPSNLRTIANVRSTPFCNAIAQHFNAAVVPMLANDRDFDAVDVQLVDLNDVFHHADYQNRYAQVRVELMKYVGRIRQTLPQIQLQINQLRAGQTLTNSAAAAAQLHQVAEKLQLAFNKQMQLSTDLGGVVQTMMSYEPPADLDVAQEELQEQSMPKDMKDIKSYLRFDGQREVVDQSENAAADSAIDLVTAHCSTQK